MRAAASAVGRKGLTRRLPRLHEHSTDESVSWASRARSTTSASATMAQALAEDPATRRTGERPAAEESRVLPATGRRTTCTLFDPGSASSRAAPRTAASRARAVRPARLGRRLHRDQRLELRLPRPHDGRGLANLYGGRAALAASSTSSSPRRRRRPSPGSYGGIIHEMLEARDVRMGQFGQSNQPSPPHPVHVRLRGQPWKTHEKVREIMRRLFVGSEIGQGYPGDEDNGEMSAWYAVQRARDLPAAGRVAASTRSGRRCSSG